MQAWIHVVFISWEREDLGPSTNPLVLWGGLGRKAFCLFSLFLQESAEVWTPVEARLTGLEETAGLSRCPAGGSSHSGTRGGSSSPQPSHIPGRPFSEPRCLLMSWGERLSALSPLPGPHITTAPRGWPGASRLWLQACALCQPGLLGQLAYRCQPGARQRARRLYRDRSALPAGAAPPRVRVVQCPTPPGGGSEAATGVWWAVEQLQLRSGFKPRLCQSLCQRSWAGN